MSDYLFTYGTLQSSGILFKELKDHATLVGTGSLEGILIHHNISNKDFPHLISDSKSLKKIEDTIGIRPQTIEGEIYRIDDHLVLKKLDHLEDALSTLEIIDAGNKKPTFIRRELKIDVLSPEYAWVYALNPDNELIKKIHKKLSTKIIVPEKNWLDYRKKREKNSLSKYVKKISTFGMETELALMAESEEFGSMNFHELSNRRGFSFKYNDGISRRYATSVKILGQALYYNLRAVDLGDNVLGYYYEIDPEVNDRFIIPHGMAYVDGQKVFDDGVSEKVRRLYPQTVREALKEHERKSVIMDKTLPKSQRFFEITGFPSELYKGFATDQANYEMTRRFHLCQALECITEVKYRGKIIDQFKLVRHSSHYNYILDDDLNGFCLSDLKTCVSNAFDGNIERSKYTCDVAQVLARTFGPLISYMTSSDEEDIEFKIRENGRLEFRNSVLDSETQLAAAIAVYVAACKTVEKKVKGIIGKDDPIKNFADLSVDDLCGSFDYSIPDIDFEPSQLRFGFMIKKGSNYQKNIHGNSPIEADYKGETKVMDIQEYIENTFKDKDFQKELSKICTPEELENINKFVKGKLVVEAKRESYKSLHSSKYLPIDYEYGNNYSTLFTHLFFLSKGEYEFNDSTHKLRIQLNSNMERDESDIKLGKLPLEITLSKLDLSVGNWKDLDSFEADITPYNYNRVTRSIHRIHRKEPIWKEYYRLK